MNKQETLEEAAEKEFPLLDTKWSRNGAAEEENLQLLGHRKSFINGAKWQQKRSYSDMQEYAMFCIECDRKEMPLLLVQDWYEHDKK